jgi:hypothetical protein
MPFDLDVRFIEAAEAELGASLPISYRDAMSNTNGGEIEAAGEDWTQYPISDTSDRKRLVRSVNDVIRETQSCRTWASFPTSAIAIAGNGAGDQLVFLSDGSRFSPFVYVWRHESGDLLKVADDFSDLRAI